MFLCLYLLIHVCLDSSSILPETLRHLVGNGTVPPEGIHRPLINLVGRRQCQSTSPSLAQRVNSTKKKQSINPFVLFTYPDVDLTLAFTALVYCVNYSILATTGSALAYAYPWLSTTLLGIAYLPSGLGMIIGTFATGRLLDAEYARVKRQHGERAREDEEEGGNGQDHCFPKEVARLRTMPAHLVVLVGATVGWGACIGTSAHIAITLVLQVICEYWSVAVTYPAVTNDMDCAVGWIGMAVLNTSTTLLIDILQSQSSGATACVSLVLISYFLFALCRGPGLLHHIPNSKTDFCSRFLPPLFQVNLVRCSLGAVIVAVTDRMVTSRLGYIGSYGLLGGVTALCIPLMYLEMKVGSRIRMRRDKLME